MAELEIVTRESRREGRNGGVLFTKNSKRPRWPSSRSIAASACAQMTRLRREIRDASGEYQVIKNTLVRRALKDTAYGSLGSLA